MYLPFSKKSKIALPKLKLRIGLKKKVVPKLKLRIGLKKKVTPKLKLSIKKKNRVLQMLIKKKPAVKVTVKKPTAKISIKLKNPLPKIKASLKKVGAKIDTGLKKTGAKISVGIKKTGAAIKKTGAKITIGLNKAGASIKNAAKKTGAAIKAGAKKVGNWFKNAWGSVKAGVSKGVSKVKAGVKISVKKPAFNLKVGLPKIKLGAKKLKVSIKKVKVSKNAPHITINRFGWFLQKPIAGEFTRTWSGYNKMTLANSVTSKIGSGCNNSAMMKRFITQNVIGGIDHDVKRAKYFFHTALKFNKVIGNSTSSRFAKFIGLKVIGLAKRVKKMFKSMLKINVKKPTLKINVKKPTLKINVKKPTLKINVKKPTLKLSIKKKNRRMQHAPGAKADDTTFAAPVDPTPAGSLKNEVSAKTTGVDLSKPKYDAAIAQPTKLTSEDDQTSPSASYVALAGFLVLFSFFMN